MCRARADLLATLHAALTAAATARGCPLAATVLSTASTFPAHAWYADGTWTPCELRFNARGAACAPAAGAALDWGVDWRHAGSPALVLLAAAPGDPGQTLAIVSRGGGRPRVFAVQSAATAVSAAVAAASSSGVDLAVDRARACTAPSLAAALAAAARERAAAEAGAPLGEWRVDRSLPPPDAPPASPPPPRAPSAPRLLTLTGTALLERDAETYDVLDARPLALLTAAASPPGEPLRAVLEWSDGVPSWEVDAAERDGLLALVAAAAAGALGAPLHLPPRRTAPLDAGLARAAAGARARGDGGEAAELEAGAAAHLAAAARALLALDGGGLGGVFSADAPAYPAPRFGSTGSGGESPPRAAPPPPPSGPVAARARLARRAATYCAVVPEAGPARPSRPDDPTLAALVALLPAPPPPSAVARGGRAGAAALTPDGAADATVALQALLRLVVSPAAGAALLAHGAAAPRVFACLDAGSPAAAAAAARLVTRLWAPAASCAGVPPWEPATRGRSAVADAAADDGVAAAAAKAVCLGAPGRAAALVGLLRGGAAPAAGAPPPPASPLASAAAVDALAAALAPPGARSTGARARSSLLAELACVGAALFDLFSHPDPRTRSGAAHLVRALAAAGPAVAAPMRDAALREGAVLTHLEAAVADAGPGGAPARALVELWCDGHPPALALLRRALPPGLARHLDAPPAAPPAPAAMRGAVVEGAGGAAAPAVASAAPAPDAPTPAPTPPAPETGPTPASAAPAPLPPPSATTSAQATTRPPHPTTPTQTCDWTSLWRDLARDHAHAGLLWNEATRRELRDSLSAERSELRRGRARAAGAAAVLWNHWEFGVAYPSLAGEPCVGGVYVRLLADAADPAAAARAHPNPGPLFAALWAALLAAGDGVVVGGGGGAGSGNARATPPTAARALLARAAATVYASRPADCGPFDGAAHLVALADAAVCAKERGALLALIDAVVAPAPARASARAAAAVARARADFLDAGGVELLVDVAADAHAEARGAGGGDGPAAGAGSAARAAAASAAGGQLASAGALLTTEAHAPDRAEWYVATPGDGGDAPDAVAPDGTPLRGPLPRPDALRAAASTSGARLWAAGMDAPALPAAVRHLRWASGSPPPGARRAAAERALRTLLALASAPVGADAAAAAGAAAGARLVPAPRVLRELSRPAILPHVAQTLVTRDPSLVSLSAALLERVAVAGPPDAAGGLFRTGAFFFALRYGGSNLAEVASLLAATHAVQDWPPGRGGGRGGGGPAASFLAPLLPAGLLHTLDRAGAGAFAAALAGDADSPELVWTAAMRAARLVPQLDAHVGDLPARLRAWPKLAYEFVPCPPVEYPELEDDLWCHRYCLRNLTDASRFPSWPVEDAVVFGQALLAEWRAELGRRPAGLTVAAALQELGLAADAAATLPSGDALRAAYRAAARKYHPDRNPAGRDKFQAAAAAYERLAAAAGDKGDRAGGGARRWRLLLLVRAQGLLYERCGSDLADYRYAGCGLLVRTIARRLAGAPDGDAGGEEDADAADSDDDSAPSPPPADAGDHFLSPDGHPVLQAALDLASATASLSPGNAAELARSGGVRVLARTLARCAGALADGAGDGERAARAAAAALAALAALAAAPDARAAMARRSGLAADMVRVMALRGAPAAAGAAVDAGAAACADGALQEGLTAAGALQAAVPLLFGYDPTLDEEEAAGGGGAGVGVGAATAAPSTAPRLAAAPSAAPSTALALAAADQGGPRPAPTAPGAPGPLPSAVSVRNALALRAASFLAALAGVAHPAGSTPPCTPARAALAALLTPPLARRLAAADHRSLLADLAGAVRNPAAIWDGDMRAALLAFLAGAAKDRAPPAALASFSYPALAGELVVAGVYVRAYCDDPGFVLADPAAFVRGLAGAVHAYNGGVASGAAAPPRVSPADRRHLAECLTALRAALEASPAAGGVLATRSALAPLVSVVERGLKGGTGDPSSDAAAAELALAVLVRSTAGAGCAAALGGDARALRAAYSAARAPPTPACRRLALRLLAPLAGGAEAAWEACAAGGALALLSVVVPRRGANAPSPPADDERAAAATVLARLTAQPLHGARVRLLLARLLPPGALAALADGPGDAAAAALVGEVDTPEHLWTKAMAAWVADEAESLARAAAAATARGGEWAPPPAPADGPAAALAAEPYVGGVYVRLFLRSPGAPLRDPAAFLAGLLDAFARDARAAPPAVAPALLASAAACALLAGRPPLRDRAAALGGVRTALGVLGARLPPRGSPTPAPSTPDDLGGAALRLLHAVADCPAGGDALAAEPPASLAPLLAAGAAWGVGAEVLAHDALARALRAAARGRPALVASAAAAGAVPILLDRLRAALAAGDGERDAAVARVAALAALAALADPAGGAPAAGVAAELGRHPAWNDNAGARADLFLPPPSGATNDAGIAGLLTGAGAARFALPPPEALAPAGDAVQREMSPTPSPAPAVRAASPPPAREPSPPPQPAREPGPMPHAPSPPPREPSPPPPAPREQSPPPPLPPPAASPQPATPPAPRRPPPADPATPVPADDDPLSGMGGGG